MSVYMITYFISDTNGCGGHDHDSCGCGGDHTHEHNHESCGCSEDHAHEHNHEEVSREANLVAKIKSLGPWAQFTPEGFFIKADSSAEVIFKELQAVANSGDIIFVTKINAETSACANPAVLDWLSQ